MICIVSSRTKQRDQLSKKKKKKKQKLFFSFSYESNTAVVKLRG